MVFTHWLHIILFLVNFVQYYAYLEKEIASCSRSGASGLVQTSSRSLCSSTSTPTYHFQSFGCPSLQGLSVPYPHSACNGTQTGSMALPLLHEDGHGHFEPMWRMQTLLGALQRPELCAQATSSATAVNSSVGLWWPMGRRPLELWRWMAGRAPQTTDAEPTASHTESEAAQSKTTHTKPQAAISAA